MTKEELELVLEALENVTKDYVEGRQYKHNKAIAAIKEALAQPEPPPECETEAEKIAFAFGWNKSLEQQRLAQPVYVAQTDWEAIAADQAMTIALMRSEQEPVAWRTFDGEGGYEYRAYDMNEDYAEAWSQRNPNHKGWVEPLYTTPPQRKPVYVAQQEQEPVAWLMYKGTHKDSFWLDKGDAYNFEMTPEHRWEPLYTTPPAAQRTWVDLTHAEFAEILCDDKWQGRPELMMLKVQQLLKEMNK